MAISAMRGDADHHHRLVGKVRGVQQPERGPCVLDVREVEEAGMIGCGSPSGSVRRTIALVSWSTTTTQRDRASSFERMRA